MLFQSRSWLLWSSLGLFSVCCYSCNYERATGVTLSSSKRRNLPFIWVWDFLPQTAPSLRANVFWGFCRPCLDLHHFIAHRQLNHVSFLFSPSYIFHQENPQSSHLLLLFPVFTIHFSPSLYSHCFYPLFYLFPFTHSSGLIPNDKIEIFCSLVFSHLTWSVFPSFLLSQLTESGQDKHSTCTQPSHLIDEETLSCWMKEFAQYRELIMENKSHWHHG